jgi:TPR repeat protein
LKRQGIALAAPFVVVAACGGSRLLVHGSAPGVIASDASVASLPVDEPAPTCPVCRSRSGEPYLATLARQYAESCDAGHLLGCIELAGLENDTPRRVSLLRQACDGGDAEACSDLAQAYASGSVEPPDLKLERQLYETACERGVGYACLAYSQSGLIMASDLKRLRQLYKGACERGVWDACVASGRKPPERKPDPDDEVCIRNTPQSDMGHLHYCRHEYDLAADAFKRECDRGDTDACATLGFMYEHGKGLPQDEARAAVLYKRGCECDNFWACGHLHSEADAGARTASSWAGPSASVCNPQPPPPCSTITLRAPRLPAAEVKISSEGVVTYAGGGFGQNGTRARSIPKVDAAKLFAQVECAGFWTWSDSYDLGSSDTPEALVTVRLGMRSKTIKDLPPCHKAFGDHSPATPPGLCDLENAIEAVAGSMTWVQCRDDAGAFQRCPEVILR